MPKLNVLVSGSTGYIGIQLVKLLVKHKYVKIKYLCGNSSVGKKISYFDKSLTSKKLPNIVKFNKRYLNEIDIIFTALPNGEAQEISNYLKANNILIDLAADFRLKKASDYLKWYKQKHKSIKNIKKSIYSLPEISKHEVKKFNIIACPGCYPTSILLPLIPLVQKKLINLKNIIIDSKSGYSGAGKNYKKKFNYKNFNSSTYAYSVNYHRHIAEIDQEFKVFKKNINFTFNPHLIPTFRGILSSIYLNKKKNISPEIITRALQSYYKNERFVKILKSNSPLGTGNVINTNNCEISVCSTLDKNKVIILSAIDNLIKGAAGQAIQNMNLAFNYNPKLGLS